MNRLLAKFFEGTEGYNIELNSLDARRIIESNNLESDENIISLGVKSLYMNVPLKEAIDKAVRKLYEQEKPPAMGKKTMKRILNMAVIRVHSKCNEKWVVQKKWFGHGCLSGHGLSKSLAQ